MMHEWVEHWEYAGSLLPHFLIVGRKSESFLRLSKSWEYQNILLSQTVPQDGVHHRKWYHECWSKRRQFTTY